jgi:hypothetical protein
MLGYSITTQQYVDLMARINPGVNEIKVGEPAGTPVS